MRRAVLPTLVLLAVSVWACGFDPFVNQRIGYRDCRPWGGSGWTHVVSDPDHCGGCNQPCGAGVPCVDGQCQLETVMNCGAPGRVCVAVDAEDVACVRFADGDTAVDGVGPPPDGLELIDGRGCVSTEGTADEDAGARGAEGAAKRSSERWLLVAGHTPACADGLETNGCVTAEVALSDLCGGGWTEPFAYDFAIMTREMTRARYRELMCDCEQPVFRQCIDLCAERDTPDAEALAERPMTGINWCEAYTACQRMDARLPTVRERARLEAMVEAPVALFDESATCSAWLAETGRVPWLAECLEQPTGELGYDDVKGAAGQVTIGRGVLTEPEPVHHLVGNVDEWMAETASMLAGGARSEWGLPRTDEALREPRLLRGRSLFSPAGLPGSRLLRVEASIRAEDVGVRCARTIGSPYGEPVPYDREVGARSYADCTEEPIGLRPVRRTLGEQVYAATSACVDSERDLPEDLRAQLRDIGRELFISPASGVRLSRRVNAGVLMEVGLARITVEEQWWVGSPAARDGDALGLLVAGLTEGLRWAGETMPRTTPCMETASASPSLADGRLARRHVFDVSREQLARLFHVSPQQACAHLDCADATLGAARCEADCTAWRLPLVFDFEQIEPASRSDLCH